MKEDDNLCNLLFQSHNPTLVSNPSILKDESSLGRPSAFLETILDRPLINLDLDYDSLALLSPCCAFWLQSKSAL